MQTNCSVSALNFVLHKATEMYILSVLIICRFHICELAYLLKFAFNPKPNTR